MDSDPRGPNITDASDTVMVVKRLISEVEDPQFELILFQGFSVGQGRAEGHKWFHILCSSGTKNHVGWMVGL